MLFSFIAYVQGGYYNDIRITRVVAPKWAQFGIHGDPAIAKTAGSGIRSGKQDPIFDGGNAWLDRNFPKLDSIRRATASVSQAAR